MHTRIITFILLLGLTTSGLAYDWEAVGMGGLTTTCIEADEYHDRILVGTNEGFHIHDLVAGTWTEFDDEGWLGRQVYAIQWDPADPLRLITGRENAFWKGYLEITEDGGVTSDLLHMSSGGAFKDIEHDYGYYYACGISDITPGELLRSVDGSAPWTPLTGHGHTAMSALGAGTMDDLYVAGDAGVWYSYDQGDTWTDITYDLGPGVVNCLEAYWPGGDVLNTVLLAGNEQGLSVSFADNFSWMPILENESCRRIAVMWAPAPWPWNRVSRVVVITTDGRVLVANQYDTDWTDETANLPSPAVDAAFSSYDWGLYVATAGDGVHRFYPVVSTVEDTPGVPSLELTAWPNPFNPRVNLRHQLPRADSGRLAVYDLKGRLVTILHEGPLPAGSTTVSWDASEQASGVYLARLECAQGMVSTRLVLVR